MGCTRASQKKQIENNIQTEIIYNEPEHHKPNILKKELTKNINLESNNNQFITEQLNDNKNEISLKRKEILNELCEKIRADKKRIGSIMKLRKELRYEKYKKAEIIDLDIIKKKDSPLSKDEVTKFFKEYPSKQYFINFKLEMKDPLMLDNGIIYYYTPASRVYLNPDSMFMLSGLRNLASIDMR